MPLPEDGRKKRGRFIKKNSALMKVVDVEDYSFIEVCPVPLLYPDNANSNIFHKSIQLEEEFETTVQPASQLRISVAEGELAAPVIFPRDFTPEWIEERKKARHRQRKMFDEEDEYEYALAMEEARRESKKIQEKQAQEAIKQSQKKTTASNTGNSNTTEDATTLQDLEEKKHNDPESTVNEQSQSSLTDSTLNALQNAHHENPGQRQLEDLQAPQNRISEEQRVQEKVDKIKEELIEQFNEQMNIEKEKWENQQTSSGFQQGYEQGNNQSDIEFKTKAEETISQLSKMVEALSHLKKDILSDTQENFEQLAQVVCESILSERLKSNPTAFLSLIRKAIDHSIAKDDFSIRVSQTFFDNLQSIDLGDLKQKIHSDQSIQDGMFKIDSKHSSISSSTKTLVEDMIKNMDLRLFSEEDSHVTNIESSEDEETLGGPEAHDDAS